MTKYLIITEPIDPEVAQARKDAAIEEAESELRDAQDALADALACPLVLEKERQIEVQPGHPNYDKASETPDWKLYMGEVAWSDDFVKKLTDSSPWGKLLETSEFPKNLGEATR